ncbi:aa3-type cytochrome c oxidase subunit IV [Sphingobium sp. BYY-5]|nr:aa3-type cytochrome c oxidase subunit IV [Sphingobium sp. BYY-5]MCI4589999.1 aa3-type cytochrome c oxidase subunit IV [Sphingobium sp. BYY-5]
MSSEGQIKSANETYHAFVGVMKWGTIASVVVAAIVVLLISS